MNNQRICGILANIIKKKGQKPMSKKMEILKIDYALLMDLRVDYAFKLIFGTGDTLFLGSVATIKN